MSLENSKEITKKAVEVNMEDTIKVVITPTAYSKISYLLQKIHNVEWSALLMYKVKGHVDNPKEMVCTVEDIYLMDKGTQAATSHSYENDAVIKAFEDFPEYMDMKIGHVHSHNSMKSFFSGTDMQELHDNASNHLYYLSLIVNNEGQFVAKLCYTGKREYKAKVTFKSKLGNWVKKSFMPTEEDILIIHNCSIFVQIADALKFNERLNEIVNKPKEYAIPKTNPFSGETGFGRSFYKDTTYDRYQRDDYFKDPTAKPSVFDKYFLDGPSPAKENYKERVHLAKMLISGDLYVSEIKPLSTVLKEVSDVYSGFNSEDISESYIAFFEEGLESLGDNFVIKAYFKAYNMDIKNPLLMSNLDFEKMTNELESSTNLIGGNVGEGITMWVDTVLSDIILEREDPKNETVWKK